MTLAEYEREVENLEAGRVPAAIKAALEGRYPGSLSEAEAARQGGAWLAGEIGRIAWSNQARAAARALVARCEAVALRN